MRAVWGSRPDAAAPQAGQPHSARLQRCRLEDRSPTGIAASAYSGIRRPSRQHAPQRVEVLLEIVLRGPVRAVGPCHQVAGRVEVVIAQPMSARRSSSITGVVRNVRWSQLQMFTVGPRGTRWRLFRRRCRGLDEHDGQAGAGEIGGGDQAVWPAPTTIASQSSFGPRGRGSRHRPILSGITEGSNVTTVSRRLADLRAPQLEEAIDSRSILVQPLGDRAARPASAVQHRPGDRRASCGGCRRASRRGARRVAAAGARIHAEVEE